MKMELIEGSETSAISIVTPGNYPKENILHTGHGESLKSRTFNNYFTSTAGNIKSTDGNAYIQNKNTPSTAIIDTSSQYVKEMRKLRYTTFQSKPTTTSKIENIIQTLKPKNSWIRLNLN